jgi:hypothetical protein
MEEKEKSRAVFEIARAERTAERGVWIQYGVDGSVRT